MKVNIPEIGVVNFPDNMSQEEIEQAIRNNFSQKVEPEESIGERALIGLGSGFTRAGQGLKQTGLRVGNALDFVSDEDYQAYTDQVKKEREFFNQTPVGQDTVAQVSQVVGEALPYMVVPGGVAGGAATKAVTGAAAGALQGATNFAETDQDRAQNTGIGAVIPVAFQGLAKPIKSLTSKFINSSKGKLKKGAQELLELSDKHGVDLLATDIDRHSLLRKYVTMLENVPIIGVSKERKLQQLQARKATEALKKQFSIDGDVDKTIQESLGNKFDTVKKVKNKLYDKVSEIAGDTKVPTKQMNQNANEIASEIGFGDKVIDEYVTQFKRDPSLSFGDLEKFRAKLNKRINSLSKNTSDEFADEKLYALTKVKQGLNEDLREFGLTHSKEAGNALTKADKFYRTQFKPLKDDKQIQNLIKTNEPDRIIPTMLKKGYGDKANKLYNALDETGRLGVRYGMIMDAYESAFDKTTSKFSPARFANYFERMEEVYPKFFKGRDKNEIEGFVKLMRHAERAGQFAEDPATGQRILPFLLGGGITSAAFGGAEEVAAAGMGAYMVKVLSTSDKGRTFLLAASKVEPGSKAIQAILENTEKLLQKAVVEARENSAGYE